MFRQSWQCSVKIGRQNILFIKKGARKVKLPPNQPFDFVVYVQGYQRQCCYLFLVDPSFLLQLHCQRCFHLPSTQEEEELSWPYWEISEGESTSTRGNFHHFFVHFYTEKGRLSFFLTGEGRRREDISKGESTTNRIIWFPHLSNFKKKKSKRTKEE